MAKLESLVSKDKKISRKLSSDYDKPPLPSPNTRPSLEKK